MKKLFIAGTIITAAFTGFAFKPFSNGKVIMIITLEVKNVVEWKKGFDAGASIREKAGIKVLSICNAINNENQVTVIEEAENAQAAHDFSNKLKEIKEKSGALFNMEIKILDKID